MESRELGFVKEELLFHSLTSDLRRQYDVVQQELMNTGIVTAICKSNMPLTRPGIWLSGLEWAGGENSKNTPFSLFTTTGNFVKANGLTLLQGRDIDTANYHTDNKACIINESAMKLFGFDNPVGQVIKDENVKWNIVGVVKDFYQSA